MGRAPCCDKANVKRGPWSPEEDATLINYVQTHGTGGNWIALPQKAGLKRCGKSCRLRWLNYLRPDIKHGGFTEEEDNIICTLYTQMGSRWSLIASQLPGRTDNDVKNYWNTKLKKKVLAGKSNFNIPNNDFDLPSNINIIIPTQPAMSAAAAALQPCLGKTEPHSLDYHSTSHSQISAPLKISSEVGFGFSIGKSQNLGLEQAMQAVANFENNNNNNINTSQEVSSVSDSISLAMEGKSVGSMAGNGSSYADDDSGNILIDRFSYDEFPYEFVNGIWSQEKGAGGVVPSYYDITSVDFSLSDIIKASRSSE